MQSDATSKLTDHVEQCERCAGILEEIADEPGDAVGSGDIGEAIREAFVPPSDLTTRVMKRISERERGIQEMSLLFGMISLTRDVAELMMSDEAGALEDEIENVNNDNEHNENPTGEQSS